MSLARVRGSQEPRRPLALLWQTRHGPSPGPSPSLHPGSVQEGVRALANSGGPGLPQTPALGWQVCPLSPASVPRDGSEALLGDPAGRPPASPATLGKWPPPWLHWGQALGRPAGDARGRGQGSRLAPARRSPLRLSCPTGQRGDHPRPEASRRIEHGKQKKPGFEESCQVPQAGQGFRAVSPRRNLTNVQEQRGHPECWPGGWGTSGEGQAE